MGLKVIQSINFEIIDDKRVVFTTQDDRIVNLTEYIESFASVLDVPANSPALELKLAGIEQSENLYMVAKGGSVLVRMVPSGKTFAECIDYELVEAVPAFLPFRFTELWFTGGAVDAQVTVASVGVNL